MEHKITALYADENGEIYDAPNIAGAGRLGNEIIKLRATDLIKLPDNADLMFLPNRQASGFDETENKIQITGQAVAAILPAGYTRTYLPAYENFDSKPLPFFGYTAAVLYKDEIYVTAIPTDLNEKWNPLIYNTRELKKLIKQVKKDLPNNRLIKHLEYCSLEWHCLTAQNIFYRRWEAGLPSSPKCNAQCLGCISKQSKKNPPSPQTRITFEPSAQELAEVGIYHLETAPEAIISFGQGCEGDPTLAANNISEAIKLMRRRTERGQINMNTNAGLTEAVVKIVDAGLNSMRVSIISAREESYDTYYKAAYNLQNVKESIRYALDHNVYISLNMLYFPGFNDRAEEYEAWREFFKELPVQMIQVRNLNIDPDWFFETMPKSQGEMFGTKNFLQKLKSEFKHLQIGSFSHYID